MTSVRDYGNPEFIIYPPCGKRVVQRYRDKQYPNAREGMLLGFCTRRKDHNGGCSHCVDDRTTHDLRVSNRVVRIMHDDGTYHDVLPE